MTALALCVLLLRAAPPLAAEPVFAYLDPATSSMITSGILGAFAAVALVVKRWYQITGLLVRTKDEPADVTAELEDTPSTQAAD